MDLDKISLKSLELFAAVARAGSLQQVASETSLSISTVSHHLKSLEDKLGVALIDHKRRPMVVTPQGAAYLRHVEDAFRALRRGQIELTAEDIGTVQNLRLGVIDDFDGEVAPQLAQILAQLLPNCTFRHRTRPSHEVLGLLARNELDLAVAATPQEAVPGIVEYPLLRDPFVMVTPASRDIPPASYVDKSAGLPFLWYPSSQLIGHQIELQLRRNRVNFDRRYEMESNHMLLAMVAGGAGWAITTAASFMRVKRLHHQIRLHTLPVPAFARTLSLFTTEIYSLPVTHLVYTAFRRLIDQRFVEPAVSANPWLADSFLLLDGASPADPD